MQHRRRLRRLVPDEALLRRRAAGEPLRELASDYGVAHTTLLRYFGRPEVAKQLREAAQELRAEERALAGQRAAVRRLEREVRRRAKEQAETEREQAGRVQAAAEATPPAEAGRALPTGPGSTSAICGDRPREPSCTARPTRSPPGSSPPGVGSRP